MRNKRIILLTTVLLLSGSSSAKEKSNIFSCLAPSQKWQAKLEFNEINNPTIYFSENQARTACQFKFENLTISPASEVPNIEAVLIPVSCNLSPELKKEMLGELYLKVTKEYGKYRGQLQWLRHSQPGPCNISQFDSEGMSRLQIRWKEGHLN